MSYNKAQIAQYKFHYNKLRKNNKLITQACIGQTPSSLWIPEQDKDRYRKRQHYS